MDELIDRYHEMEEKSLKRRQRIKENEDYINWLDKYSENSPFMTNDIYLFSDADETEENKENTECIEELFNVISEYAKQNYIMPEKDELGEYYKITHNTNDYKIGYAAGEEIFYYCSRTVFIEGQRTNVIDFKDIIKNVKAPDAAVIELKMKKLRLLLTELKLAKIDEYFVKEEVSKAYTKRR
ncbi:MAG: hypothetical protein IKG27_01140 [Bacilli bacterium]|nr:hypothetical protein [Bacilli bacterium]